MKVERKFLRLTLVGLRSIAGPSFKHVVDEEILTNYLADGGK